MLAIDFAGADFVSVSFCCLVVDTAVGRVVDDEVPDDFEILVPLITCCSVLGADLTSSA